MYIQYTRDRSVDGGNTPQIFGKGWKDDRTIEERLVATTPDVSATAPTTFVDADHGGDKDTKRSTSGLVVMMNGGPVTWFSRLQKLTALSSAESEIFAVWTLLRRHYTFDFSARRWECALLGNQCEYTKTIRHAFKWDIRYAGAILRGISNYV
jgi:hypothetical protein